MRNISLTALVFFGSAQAFNPSAKNNVAVYWGQRNSNLATLCTNPAIDVVLLSFMHTFPSSQDASGLPGTNFAGNCNSAPYPGSHLLQPCDPMPQNIKICQKNGKKVILALGGEGGYQLVSAAAGEYFADKLWAMAGPMSANNGEPRPFGSAGVDGFDFDIEIPSPDHQAGYIAMINRLRLHFSNEDKQYLITGAPQCIVPDNNMGEMMTKAQFDILFVQYYNTPECSARTFVDTGKGITYDALTESLKGSPSENAKIYLGLPAAADAANSGYYLQPNEVEKLAQAHASKDNLGGIMLWDAARAEENVSGGKSYHELMKDILNKFTKGAIRSNVQGAYKRPIATLQKSTSLFKVITKSRPASVHSKVAPARSSPSASSKASSTSRFSPKTSSVSYSNPTRKPTLPSSSSTSKRTTTLSAPQTSAPIVSASVTRPSSAAKGSPTSTFETTIKLNEVVKEAKTGSTAKNAPGVVGLALGAMAVAFPFFA